MAHAPVAFTKLQGLGNDYLFLDGIATPLPPDLPRLAVAMSDRHFGAGADGIISVERGTKAPLRMRIWNADGSEAQMCGNGVRGFAKFCYERGYVPDGHRVFPVETAGGTVVPEVVVEADRVTHVRVDMGEPRLRRADIPMEGRPQGDCVEEPVDVGDVRLRITAVSMGNPHVVTFVEDAARTAVHTLGPRLEGDTLFPERVNVGFAQVAGSAELRLRVWERGSGETLACGTGACAAVVAAVRTGRTGRAVTVHLPGGSLQIEWAANNHVFMTGPTVEVYQGVYQPK